MLKVSRQSAQVDDLGPAEDRHEDLEGYTVNFLSFRQGVDSTEMLKGMPDDSCQCPHWGYVFKGRLTFRFSDHTEVFEPGDAFYLPSGHVMLADAGSEYLQFSPSDLLAPVQAALAKNLQERQERD